MRTLLTSLLLMLCLAAPLRAAEPASGPSPSDDALSMRAGLALAVVVAAQRWLASKPGDVESLLAVLLIVAPVAAAISRLCGPWIPASIQRLVWRAGRDWR